MAFGSFSLKCHFENQLHYTSMLNRYISYANVGGGFGCFVVVVATTFLKIVLNTNLLKQELK